jgi:hypothetical protein
MPTGTPTSTAPSAAAFTKAFEPQMKTCPGASGKRDQLAHHRAVDAAAVVAIAHRSPARQRDQNVTNFSQWD